MTAGTGSGAGAPDAHLLAGLFDSNPVGQALLDRDLRFRHVNPALCAMTGLPPEELAGRAPWEVWPDVDPEAYRRALVAARDGHPTTRVTVVAGDRARPGRVHRWEVSAHPVRGRDGQVVAVGVGVLDVTEREEAQASGRDEASLRLILRSAPTAMLLVDEAGTITDANPEAERLFGYQPGELLGRSVEVLVPAASRGRHPPLRAQFARDPRTGAMGHGRDLTGVRKDGTEFPVEVGLGAAPDRPGLVTYAVTDLSERQRAEAERAARQRLSRLQHVTEAGLVHLAVDELLRELLARVLRMLGGEAATVLLLDERGAALVPAASIGLEEEVAAGVRIPLGQGISGRVAATRHARLVRDVAGEEVFSEFLRRRGLQSMVVAPLLVEGRVVGVLYVGSEERGRYDEDDLELLQIVAERVALAVDRAQAFERERSIAETLQHSLLPDTLPQVEGVALAARYRPGAAGAKVGGDWYDAVPLPDGALGLVMGDVMGHGVRSAAVMGQLRHMARAYLTVALPLPLVAEELNRAVLRLGEGEITTVLVARLDPGAGRLDWVSAGHLPPIVRRADGHVELLPPTPDVPLGSAVGWSFSVRTLDLEPGSTALLYTDGLVEHRGGSLDTCLARLRQAVADAPAAPEALCDAVLEALVGGGSSDDVALLALHVPAVAVPPLVLDGPVDVESVGEVRARLREWLARAGASDDEAHELVVAAGEALAAAATRADRGPSCWHVEARLVGRRVDVLVSDGGRWRPPTGTEGGRSLVVMEALVDELAIDRGGDGRTVRLSRRLGGQPG